MNYDHKGPIISRGDSRQEKIRRRLKMFFIAFITAMLSIAYFTYEENSEFQRQFMEEEQQEAVLPEIIEEFSEEPVIEEVPVVEVVEEKEEESVEYFYQRALEKEKAKDYRGASEDYTATIERASKYSAELWNALNNRGIIRARQFKDYKGAMADFNQIIDTELNRTDGNMNTTRLEAGYLNRAYVKKAKGDKEGACNDLYEALGLGIPSSVSFIEKKIEQTCW